MGDVSFFEQDMTRRTGRTTAVVTSAERPVPLNFSYVMTTVLETIEELLVTHGAPVYIVHFTRAAALVLLGMTTVIEVFVYPLAWPTHIQWASMLLVLICRGPGELSIDQLLWRRFRHLPGAESPTA